MMTLLIAGLASLLAGVILLAGLRWPRKIEEWIFGISLAAGCGAGLLSSLLVLVRQESYEWRWNMSWPIGQFYIALDGLSAFFLLLITILFFAAGLYSVGYLRQSRHEKSVRGHRAWYLGMLISLVLVVTAKNAVLFLIAWEMMSVTSYFLMTFEDKEEKVRNAGYLYLIATHTAAFCLWIMFILLYRASGSMDFDMMRASPLTSQTAGWIFLLGVLGFGTKAGIVPLHIWLPHAHPAAPSHISAVLSGVMIKMGIYGILRLIGILDQLPPLCAVVLMAVGVISGLGGVIAAIGQREIKSILAYSSIENIGIIVLAVGAGLWGHIYHHAWLATLGWTGALLHVFNHGLFKGLLFMSAGTLIKSTHTGDLNRLGGILKYLPWTGHAFLIGSLAVSGLPLLNGFAGEFMIYRALFAGINTLGPMGSLFSGLSVMALALIGALSIIVFTRAFGCAFLGQRRTDRTIYLGAENDAFIKISTGFLAFCCFAGGIFPALFVFGAYRGLYGMIPGVNGSVAGGDLLGPMLSAGGILLMICAVFGLLFAAKKIAAKRLPLARSETWGCGYAGTSPRMQYTATSFVDPVARLFRGVINRKVEGGKSVKYFPEGARVETSTSDIPEKYIFRPAYSMINSVCAKLKVIQFGYTQVYLLYIVIFLLSILIWKSN